VSPNQPGGSRYLWHLLIALALFFSTIFCILPYLWRTLASPVVVGLLVLLLIPLIGTMNDYLLADVIPPGGLRALCRAYLVTLFSLVYELTAILLAVPFIAVNLGAVLGGMMLLVTLLGLVFYGLQTLGLQVVRTLTPQDFRDTLTWFGYALAFELGCGALILFEQRYKDRAFDACARIYERVMDRINRGDTGGHG